MASLTVSKHIRAKREKVYAAWTTPEIMNQWFAPKGMKLVDSSADVRVGGSFHAVMSGPPGTVTVRGVYKELVANEKIVFTHRWEEPDAAETLVTVLFADRDGGTEVTLTHERLRNEEVARSHTEGWNGTLESLESYFARTT